MSRLGLKNFALFIVVGIACLAGTAAFADYLTVYAIPSAFGNDYSSPRRLALGTTRNYNSGVPYPYGHAAFHLQCDAAGYDQPAVDILDGINVVELAEGESLARQRGYGLGVIFANMRGHFEGPEQTAAGVNLYMNSGSAAFIRFEISAGACRRMAAFVDEYTARGLPASYGLAVRPRYQEGANCASFVAALLEIAGLADPAMMQSWQVGLRVPSYLVGGPMTGYFIPGWHFLVRPFWAGHWAGPDDAHFYAAFYDPGLLYWHIRNRWQQGLSPLNNPAASAQMVSQGRATGFNVDATALPVPLEPFWLSDL